MPSINVCTFNCLHIYHEKRYVPDSLTLQAHSNEPKRIQGLVAFISSQLTNDTVVCLQEVSGDLLSALREEFNATHHVISLAHNRVPQPVDDFRYADPGEYLCTIIPCSVDKETIKEEFLYFTTKGKGALITSFGNVMIINTHCTVHEQGVLDLVSLYTLFGQPFVEINSNHYVLLLGDTNNEIKAILEVFDQVHPGRVSNVVDHDAIGIPTFTPTSVCIDHVFGFNTISFEDSTVTDTAYLSDHRALHTTCYK
jgi:hypothetical protein